MAVLSPARSRALLALQDLRGRRDPSSFEWEVADRAIDMALSPERPESLFLVRHCLRNASSVLALSRRRARVRGMDEVPVDDTAVMAVADEAPSAFDALAWSRVYSAFVNDVAALHPHASAVLAGMEAGEPIVATAAALGVSDRLVKSLRSTIRSISGAALAAGRA
jgi:hypothetical protein